MENETFRPKSKSDRVALFLTMFFRIFADAFFSKRYGHRAVVLETIAGVPGMVAGMWTHLKSLRNMQQDETRPGRRSHVAPAGWSSTRE